MKVLSYVLILGGLAGLSIGILIAVGSSLVSGFGSKPIDPWFDCILGSLFVILGARNLWSARHRGEKPVS
jgi:hypothetical protein